MKKNYKKVIVILADGARPDVIQELSALGKLPYISEHLINAGTDFKATTTFPSTTGPAYLPFLTGNFAGTANMPGIRWFDKKAFAKGVGWPAGHRSYVGLESYFMGKDIKPGTETLFDLIPEAYNIFNAVTPRFGKRNLTKLSRIWYWYYAHLTDHWAFADKAAHEKTMNALRIPDLRFLFVVYPGIDEYGHLAGPKHEATLESYKFLDESIGEIVEELKKKNEWEDTQLWIVSDHGLSKTDHHFCINTFLEERDFPTFYYPLIHRRFKARAASMVSGNGMSNISFRNHDGWQRSTTQEELKKISPDLLKDFLAQEAVDVMAIRNDEGGFDILSKRGEAKVKEEGDKLRYEVLSTDPFGYEVLPQSMSFAESFERTIDSEYPDAPLQLAQLLRSPRAGDMIISAKTGHDLRLRFEHPEHHGSHGSLHWEHMRCVMLCNTAFTRKHARSADLFPTVLDTLKLKPTQNCDGVAIL